MKSFFVGLWSLAAFVGYGATLEQVELRFARADLTSAPLSLASLYEQAQCNLPLIYHEGSPAWCERLKIDNKIKEEGWTPENKALLLSHLSTFFRKE